MTVAVCFGVAAVALPPAIALAIMSYHFAKRSEGFGVLTGLMSAALTLTSVYALGCAICESAPRDVTPPHVAPAEKP